jgi:hypothetical protein
VTAAAIAATIAAAIAATIAATIVFLNIQYIILSATRFAHSSLRSFHRNF